MVFSDFLLQVDPPFCSNPLFCKGFHAFPGLQWPISGPLEPKKMFFAKKAFLINDQVAGPSSRFELFESKKLFWIKKTFFNQPEQSISPTSRKK